ncbi:MAG TPA: hypothetical protein VFN21_03465, partial [Acidimicrobiales bacterium]|nr:hypothetical protein [Acidimicrobiales bacterium]
MPLPLPVRLVGSGHVHPERELTSSTLERSVPGLYDGWSEKYLGMRSRRVLGINEQINELLIESATLALHAAGWRGDSLDAIVGGSLYPDQVLPASASYVAQAHSQSAVAFDVKAACAGFIYALSVANGLLQTGRYRRAAVCVGDHPTAYADYTDSHSSVFFGDAAGTVLLTTEEPAGACFEVMDVVLNGDHEYPEKVYTHRRGNFQSDGRYSFGRVMGLGTDAIKKVLDQNGVAASDVVGVAFHQASRRVLEEISVRTAIPVDRHWH